MEINSPGPDQYYLTQQSRIRDFSRRSLSENVNNPAQDQELKEVAGDFAALFIKQVFKSMRDSLPENKYIDGGFAEDVYTDLLDTELSKKASIEPLNRMLYDQLKRQMNGDVR